MVQTTLNGGMAGQGTHSKAEEMASKQREISVAAFFEKNRHLLGFDNPRKALLTAVKEAVDNSLDACEEAGIMPEVIVEIIELSENRHRVVVEDNGPGIVKAQIPKVFAKLLYGSKFYKLSQSRGQQGIGISASVLYAQLTTGRPAKIVSKTGSNQPAHYYELHIDIDNNKPEIVKDEVKEWGKHSGTRIELDLEGTYLKGSQSVDEYLKETAIVNPHVTIIYTNPKAEQIIFPRAVEKMPVLPKEIKPHPYGIELGMLIRMLKATESRTMQAFLTSEFSRVGHGTAKEICENAAILPNSKPKEATRETAEQLMNGIKKTKIIAPPTDCISPIGSDELERGIKKEINAEFYTAITRAPQVYRGNPFIIEVGLAYGGEQPADKPARMMRYANRVPLLYQPGACAVTKSIAGISWKPYGMQQSGSNVPIGPLTIVVHMASVWVPFTSESKEAIAHYPDIIKEIKLALQDCGRRLGSYVNKKRRVGAQLERVNLFEKYIPEVADSLSALSGAKKEKILENLNRMTKKDEIQKAMEIEANSEYDAELAEISKDEEEREMDE
jgi:DNA topoisomerase-6 subunit B